MKGSVVVAFDIGSTLIHPDFVTLAKWLHTNTGITRAPDEVRRAFRMAVSGDIYQQRADPILQEAGIFFSACRIETSKDQAHFVDLWREIANAGGSNSWLYTRVDAEARPVLTELRKLGIELVAASNSDGTLSEELREAGLSEFFNYRFDSASIGVEKPHSAFYATVLKPFPHAYSIHIGDDLIKDCIAAGAAGFRRALLYDPSDFYRGLPNHTKISRLSVLLKILRDVQ